MSEHNDTEPTPEPSEDHGHGHGHGTGEGWFYQPANIKKVIWGTLGLCAISVIADLFYEKHGHYGWEEWFGFHAAYGFASCVLLVLAATQLRKIVMRDEDYYDD